MLPALSLVSAVLWNAPLWRLPPLLRANQAPAAAPLTAALPVGILPASLENP
uniref:Uncharacterized protein n=1 Tax=Rhodocyclus tenuis TaxID=1066 RepID=A0A840FWY3_RHOTE|nr:hypothetical protein [Rhodocyclus tenuis]